MKKKKNKSKNNIDNSFAGCFFLFVFLFSLNGKIRQSAVRYYVDLKSTNNNSLTCGLEIDNACSDIATAIQAYKQSKTKIPLIIELAEGVYLEDGDFQLDPIGMRITIQPQPNANVTLNVGPQQLIYIDESIKEAPDTFVTFNRLNFINTPLLVYVSTATLNISVLVCSCTFSDTKRFRDFKAFVFDINTDSDNDNNLVEVYIMNSTFSNLNGGVLKSHGATSYITNTLITNISDYKVIHVITGSLYITGIRYISNTAIQHIFVESECEIVEIYDSIFENNKNFGTGYGLIIHAEASVDNLFIINSSFNNNSGSNTIGLAEVINSVIRYCNFTVNIAIAQEDYDPDFAAVIVYLSPTDSIISNCLFSNNTVPINIIKTLGSIQDSVFHMYNNQFENNIFQNISIATDINLYQLNAAVENTIFNESQNIHAISCNTSNLLVSGNQFIGNSQAKSLCKGYNCKVNGITASHIKWRSNCCYCSWLYTIY